MSQPTNPLDLEAAATAIESATAELSRICKETWAGGKPWHWEIPANPARDSDLLLGGAIEVAQKAVKEIRSLREEVTRLKAEAPPPVLNTGEATATDDLREAIKCVLESTLSPKADRDWVAGRIMSLIHNAPKAPPETPKGDKQPAVMTARGRMHVLKCHPEPYRAIINGEKPFEWRKFDRDYQVGDVLTLQLFYPESGEFSLQSIQKRVTYIISEGFGIPAGYCIMGLGPLVREALPPESETAKPTLDKDEIPDMFDAAYQYGWGDATEEEAADPRRVEAAWKAYLEQLPTPGKEAGE